MRSYIVVLSVLVALVGAVRPSHAEPPSPDAAPTGDVRGVVLDADGGPAEGVVVEAEDAKLEDDDSFVPSAWSELADRVLADTAQPRRILARAVTGPDGSFHLAGLPLDRTVRLTTVPAPPHVPAALLTRARVTPSRTVTLRLVPGHTLRVHVVDAGGEGIAARVAVSPWPARMARATGWDAEEGAWDGAEANSDAKGNAVLAGVPGGEAVVTVVASGLGAVRRRVTLPLDAMLELALGDAQGGVIEGSVRETTGHPVPGATLAWATGSWIEPRVQVAQTDAESCFRLEGVPAGAARLVRIDAHGLVLPDAQALRFGAVTVSTAAAAHADVVLIPAGAITGSVRDATGKPVVGAEIVAHYKEPTRLSDRSGTRFTRTAEDGTYTISGLCPGRGWVRVKDLAAAFPLRVPSHDMFHHIYEVPFVLHEAGDTCERDFVVRAGTPPVLSGRVEDEAGGPVAGAIVTATRLLIAMDGTPSASARSGASGHFAIPLPTSYPEWGVVAVIGERMSPQQIVKVDETEPVLRVAPWAAVSGRVVSSTGKPLAGAVVVPREKPVRTSGSHTRSNPVTTTVVTEVDGRFVVRGLREGEVSFWFSHGGTWLHPIQLRNAPPAPDQAVFTVTPGTVMHDVVLRALPTGTIAGTVTDTAGQPVAGTSVALKLDVRSTAPRRRARTTTDAAGRFRAEGLLAGQYAVAVDGKTSGKLATGTLDAKIVIPEPPPVVRRKVAGLVTGPDGKPVALARADVEGAAKSVKGTGLILQGRFHEVVEMGAGQGRVRITDAYDAAGRPLGTLDESVVIPAGEPETLEVQLRRGEVVDGRVVDQDGQPVGGVVVSLDFVEGPFSEPGGALEGFWWTRTRGDGTFRFVGLEPADRLVHVRPEGDGVAPPGVPVEHGATGLQIAISCGARISGIVLDESGERFPAAKVSATWQGRSPGEIRGVATDERAAFTLVVPIDAEHVTVRARFMPVEMPRTPKAVARNVKPGTQDLVLRFTRGGVLRGTVVGPEGEPVPSGWVMVLDEPDDPVPTPSPFGPAQRPYGGISAGAFEVRDAPEGRRRVVAIPQGDEYAPSDVVDVTIPGDGVRIRVPRSVEVSVQVEGSEGAVFDAVWTGAAADGTPVWRTGRVGEDGHLTLRLPPAMEGTLYVRSSTDDRYVYVDSFAAESGSEPSILSLRMGLSITGTVDGLTQAEAEGATLVASGETLRSATRLSGDGSFLLRGLPTGKYEITVDVPAPVSFATSLAPQVIEAGAQDVVIRSGIRRVQAR